jgi:hypothetical protein
MASPGQCNGACYRAQRAYRLGLLPQALSLLSDCETLHFVTLASPHWRRPVGQIHTVRPDAIKQWLRRRLLRTQPATIAIGGIEVSFNVERDGSTSWAPHVHMIVANVSAAAIKSAFATDRFTALKSKSEKPLRVEPVTDLGKQLGYCVKGHVVERVAYIGSHGRQTRKTNRLRADLLAEYDRWLAASNVADRLILIGVRWYPTDQRLRVL